MNDLPEALLAIIEKELNRFPPHALKRAREELTKRYKEGLQTTPFMTSEAHRTAYAVARMPATYAVCSHLFDEIGKWVDTVQFSSLLDLGSGPGTAAFAAIASYPHLSKATLFEQDSSLIELSRRLAKPLEGVEIHWEKRNILKETDLPEHDLLLLSYSFGELPAEKQEGLIDRCWRAAKRAVVLVEPGTPKGFENIIRARSRLLSLGAHLIAPCPHANKCPMVGEGWCHFSKRVQRSKFHRLIKEGDLGYEDEKYAYIAAAKEPSLPYSARILGSPRKHSGRSEFFLCSSEGLVRKSLSKRDGDLYKAARKLSWGETFP